MTTDTRTTYRCKRCDVEVAINPKQPHIRTCGSCLSELQREGRKKAARKRPKVAGRQPRICEECKVLYRPGHKDQRFCCMSCSNKHNSQQAHSTRREKSKAATETDTAENISAPADVEQEPVVLPDTDRRRRVLTSVGKYLAGMMADMYDTIDTLRETSDDMQGKLATLSQRDQMSPTIASVDQAEAEFAYIKDSLRKLLHAVEDMGIRQTAIDSRLTRLEKDLGV